MRPKILLTSSPPDAGSFDYGHRPFAVVGDGYRAPVGMPAVTVAEANAFREQWGEGTMVMVGLSRIFTPANRCKMHEVFHRARAGMSWISVDDRLFVGDPWRMLWHFTAVGADFAGLTDSYLAETRYLRAEAEREPCPFRLEEVERYGRSVVVAMPDAYLHGQVLVEEHPVSDAVRTQYAAEKEAAFRDEKTLAAILGRLTTIAKNVLPNRLLPTPSQISKYPRGYSIRIVSTDLPVDRFLIGRLRKVVELTNAISQVFA